MSNHGVAATSGHLYGSPGIRGHSAGDVFPYVIMLKGNPHESLTYHVIGPGIKEGMVTATSYELAHDSALKLKERL